MVGRSRLQKNDGRACFYQSPRNDAAGRTGPNDNEIRDRQLNGTVNPFAIAINALASTPPLMRSSSPPSSHTP